MLRNIMMQIADVNINLRTLSHEATFAGNLDATNCSAYYMTTLVANGTRFKHCLMIHKRNRCTLKCECLFFLEKQTNQCCRKNSRSMAVSELAATATAGSLRQHALKYT